MRNTAGSLASAFWTTKFPAGEGSASTGMFFCFEVFAQKTGSPQSRHETTRNSLT